MAELDIEALKRQVQWIRAHPMTVFPTGRKPNFVLLTVDHTNAIIAALEERDRLQKEIEVLRAQVLTLRGLVRFAAGSDG